MKNLLLISVVSGLIGSTVAWAIHHNRHGYRMAEMGPFTVDGEFAASDVPSIANLTDVSLDQGPRAVVIGDADYDFGVMRPETLGEHQFLIRNEGKKSLKLWIGATTCKCTLGSLENDMLEPGEETSVTLTWRAKPGIKRFGQSAELRTSDADNPAIKLSITGKVINTFELVPSVWSFGESAIGEDFEVSGEIYSYMNLQLDALKCEFSLEELQELSEVEYEPIPRDEFATGRELAKFGYRVKAKVKSGMPQGNLSQNLVFHYKLSEMEGSAEEASASEPQDDSETTGSAADSQSQSDSGNEGSENGDSENGDSQNGDSESEVSSEKLKLPQKTSAEELEELRESPDDDFVRALSVPVRGRIVGPLRMIESSKLKKAGGGRYRYLFGKLGRSGGTANTFIMVKGKDRKNTKLMIEGTSPESTIRATLGEPKDRGQMVLHPLKIEVIRGEESVERMGKTKDDYGSVLIVTDNETKSKMEVQVMFAVEGK